MIGSWYRPKEEGCFDEVFCTYKANHHQLGPGAITIHVIVEEKIRHFTGGIDDKTDGKEECRKEEQDGNIEAQKY